MSPPPSASRKFMYPEKSVPYTFYLKPRDPEEIFQQLKKKQPLQLTPRPMFLSIGALRQVKGSAYLEYGKTKVMASVQAPREMTKLARKGALGQIVCTVKYASFATEDYSINIPRHESFLSVALKKALDPVVCRHEFSNFQLDINVIVLDDDGCVLSTAINCCGAALADAGVPIYDIITASTICLYRGVEFVNPDATIESLLLSLSAESAEKGNGLVVTASLPQMGQVTECFQRGYMLHDNLERLTEHSLIVNNKMFDSIKYVLISKTKKHLRDKAEI